MYKHPRSVTWLPSLPSFLSLARALLLLPLALVLVLPDSTASASSGLGFAAIVALAAGTDWADGWIARRYGMCSEGGAVLDQIADKLFLNGACILAWGTGWLTPTDGGAVLILLSRDLAISGLREYAARKGTPVHVNDWGKGKTACLFLALLLVSLAPAMGAWQATTLFVGEIFLWVGAGTALFSAWQYLRLAFPLFHAPDEG